MDPLALLAKYSVGTLLAGSCLLLSLCAYHARDAIRAWLDARGKGLSEERARTVGESAGETINGKLEEMIDARLRATRLREEFDRHVDEARRDRDRLTRVEGDVDNLKERVDEMRQENREEHAETRREVRELTTSVDRRMDDFTTTASLRLSEILKAIERKSL